MQRQGWHLSFCFTAALTPGEFITYSDIFGYRWIWHTEAWYVPQ